MQAKVYLNQPLTQDRYGLHFDKGEALCDNEYIIKKLQKKGVKVEIISEEKTNEGEPKTEKTIDEMTVVELKKYAEENKIEIPSNVKNKADIIEFIKNYEPEDDGQDDEPEDDGQDDNNSDNTVENENTEGEPKTE